MIYLDYSATTPLDPAVLKKMLPYFSREFANPASIHTPGQKALKAVEDARHLIASLINARATELVFTSGATEANNLALQGLLKGVRHKGDTRKEIVTTAIEHDSILEPLGHLAEQGYIIKRLPVDNKGIVKPAALKAALNEKTLLISINYVNSEVGTIQPLDRIGRSIKKFNEKRAKEWLKMSPRKRREKPRPIYLHTDATQAFNALSCDVKKLHVDLLSLSGHKLYGPKGIGLLYIKRDTPFEALQYGGHQERNLRSGTLNVPGIIGLAEAMKLAAGQRVRFIKETSKLRDRLITGVKKILPDAVIATTVDASSPMHANIIFPGVEGDALLVELDRRGLAVSTGSACASGDLDASHVLVALGYSQKEARSAIRFTLGRPTTFEEIKKAMNILQQAVQSCRRRG